MTQFTDGFEKKAFKMPGRDVMSTLLGSLVGGGVGAGIGYAKSDSQGPMFDSEEESPSHMKSTLIGAGLGALGGGIGGFGLNKGIGAIESGWAQRNTDLAEMAGRKEKEMADAAHAGLLKQLETEATSAGKGRAEKAWSQGNNYDRFPIHIPGMDSANKKFLALTEKLEQVQSNVNKYRSKKPDIFGKMKDPKFQKIKKERDLLQSQLEDHLESVKEKMTKHFSGLQMTKLKKKHGV